MSPNYSYSSYANEFFGTYGSFSNGHYYVSDTNNVVRPVINLNSDVTVTGSGTQSDPYVVEQ